MLQDKKGVFSVIFPIQKQIARWGWWLLKMFKISDKEDPLYFGQC